MGFLGRRLAFHGLGAYRVFAETINKLADYLDIRFSGDRRQICSPGIACLVLPFHLGNGLEETLRFGTLEGSRWRPLCSDQTTKSGISFLLLVSAERNARLNCSQPNNSQRQKRSLPLE